MERNQFVSRSIPACAGEPDDRPFASGPPRVYPRVCGGTVPVSPNHLRNHGVYPRVCGGTTRRYLRLTERSIPACAGEPKRLSDHRRYTLPGLSPRVRGNRNGCRQSRLSPRVRGNLIQSHGQSIPACAGEPLHEEYREAESPRVRGNGLSPPRVRGNRQPSRVCGGNTIGLSPRVRGNPLAN